MKSYGYNINFGVVADVAEDINDAKIFLVKRERIFSDNPKIVSELTGKMVEAMGEEGIIPVVKHFPGLGRARSDSHRWLPKINAPEEEIYKKDIFPFEKLIKDGKLFWIMTSHAVYPCFDDKPASLSYKIQTEILRKKLGFQGIIISDELLNMQAVQGYAFEQKIKEPHINEIVIMAFKAGTDIVIIYPQPDKAKELIGGVIKAGIAAVKDGRISEKEINDSLERILKEKERIFGVNLLFLIKNITLEEKIAQKIIIDIYDEKGSKIINNYCLSGIEARDYKLIESAQKKAKIPLFICGQHEGGKINEFNLKLYSQSAGSIGRQFEKISRKEQPKLEIQALGNSGNHNNKPRESFFDFSQLVKEEQSKIINILSDSVGGHIKFYTDLKENGNRLSNPDFFSPLSTTSPDVSRGVEVKLFKALPITWIKKFPDKNMALCAYKVLKEAFNIWHEKNNISSRILDKNFLLAPGEMINMLNLLKEEIKNFPGAKVKKRLRVLCLAAHPDDEDAEALLYFKKKFAVQTYILLATRGEGGENRIGPELYQELGALRTEEIEKSASILGVNRIFYLGKKDFGYCCEQEEALQKWDKQDTLFRLVYFYRLIQPDIIVTKHNAFSGHCQHQALSSLAQEAFDLAGNPKVYPEMIKDGLLPWQLQGYYQRAVKKSDYPLAEITIDSQEIASLQGKTIQQVAQEALSRHASQGLSANSFSSVLPRGEISYESVKINDFSAKQGFLNEDTSPGKKQGVIPSGFLGVKIINGLKIGLIEENSNILFIALKTLGCNFKKINIQHSGEVNFSDFDVIVLSKGMNNFLSEFKGFDNQALKFVEKGGSLIIMLQDRASQEFTFAPYPLRISFDRLSNENIPVKILVPGHPLFNYPNKITAGDFKEWVQDRANITASEYSDKYIELTSSFSCSGKAVKGAYLSARYGKGSYIFTTYAWYRQLREFHPGAYKNLANMLSYSKAEPSASNN
ncbi:MAG: glycoside hydrolase family 3 N-terminal domain-containing protein [Candidatus Omnitrophota bacterium]